LCSSKNLNKNSPKEAWKKFKGVVKKLNYKVSRADPCLCIRKEGNELLYLFVCVDDGGNCSKYDIKDVLKAFAKHFVVNDIGEMKTFVGFNQQSK
jgi:hypothetical protein